MSRRLRRRWRQAVESAGAVLMETLSAILPLIPAAIRFPAVRFLGRVFAFTSPSMKRAVAINFQKLFGMSGESLRQRQNNIFENFALTLYDFFFPIGIHVDVPQKEALEELRKKHPAMLFLTFHMGQWEIGARILQSWGWPVTAVYQPYRNKRFRRMIEKRRAPGVQFIPVGGRAAYGVRTALKEGRVVAMLGDLALGERGVPVKLLGKTVYWPKGPVLLAVREGVPIVVSVIIRTGTRRYRSIVHDPFIPTNRSRDEVNQLVQQVADKFGEWVAEFPDQWYRFKPFDFDESTR